MTYDERMDPECIPLCDALNSLPGIETSSCCGHGQHPFRIFFSAETVESLRPILVSLDDDSMRWEVKAGWASGSDNLYFYLEGPRGKKAYRQANLLASYLLEAKAQHA